MADQAKMKELKENIRQLRSEIEVLNKEKEAWMAKKNSFKQEILKHIGAVKELRNERNTLTTEVKLSKEERGKAGERIPELTAKLKELKDTRDALSKKNGLRKNAMGVKREIERMQHRMETMPMSFTAEKNLMKQIKDKQKMLAGAEEIFKLSRQIKETYKLLDAYRAAHDEQHSTVKEKAKGSQEKHETMLAESAKIDDLRKKEQEAFDKFKEFKTQYKDKSAVLSEHIKQLNDLYKELGIKEEEKQRHKTVAQKKSLAQRRKEVEERMTRGEKLTTEDLLVLQSDE